MKELTSYEPLRLVFLGCGFAASLHSKTLRQLRQNVRCYYASRDPDRSAAYNQRYRGHGHFSSYQEAIQSENTDVVFITTPPVYHLPLALDALQAGKHVIIEKPAFLKSSDFDMVQNAQAKTERQILVAENYFYKPVATKLRALLATDVIGEVRFISINALKWQVVDGWRDDRQIAGGGALFEGGIHWINFMTNLGFSVKSAYGLRPGIHEGVERSILVNIEYSNGVLATLHYSWEIPSLFKGLRISKIYGTRGSVTFESNGLFIFVRGRKQRLIIPRWDDVAGYKAMFRDFIHSLRSGENAQMGPSYARRDLELVESIYQSIGY